MDSRDRPNRKSPLILLHSSHPDILTSPLSLLLSFLAQGKDTLNIKAKTLDSFFSKSSKHLKSTPTSSKSPKPGVRLPNSLSYPDPYCLGHLTFNTSVADHLEKPTPRAISERLCKIRATTKANGSAGSFSVGGVKTATPTGTPKKRAANGTGSGRGVRKNRAAGKGAGAKGAAGGGGNKKRNGNVGDEYVLPLSLSRNHLQRLTHTIHSMSDDSEAEEVKSESDATLGSPSKKAKGAIKVEQNEDAGVVEPDFV